jgi:hypothetical protein
LSSIEKREDPQNEDLSQSINTASICKAFGPKPLTLCLRRRGESRATSPKPSNKEATKMKTLIPAFLRASGHGLWLTTIAIALVLGGSAPYCWSGPSGQTSDIPVLSSDPWQANELITPERLAKWLSATSGGKPLVICVAFPVLYPGGHIVGAKFAGPTAKPEGIQALKRAANGLSQDKQIVLYCGCWARLIQAAGELDSCGDEFSFLFRKGRNYKTLKPSRVGCAIFP